MNRNNQAAANSTDITIIHQTARDVETVEEVTLSAVLEDYAGDILGVMPGPRLKFVKGEWIADSIPVDNPDERYIALPSSITKTWEKWENKTIVDRIVCPLGKKLAPRSALGDHDAGAWEFGPDGRERDPWVEAHYLGLIRERDQVEFVFVTKSLGGRRAIARLARAAGKTGKSPIIELASDSYPHPTFGKVLEPQFDIVGWTDIGAATAPLAHPKPVDIEAIPPARIEDVPSGLIGPNEDIGPWWQQ